MNDILNSLSSLSFKNVNINKIEEISSTEIYVHLEDNEDLFKGFRIVKLNNDNYDTMFDLKETFALISDKTVQGINAVIDRLVFFIE